MNLFGSVNREKQRDLQRVQDYRFVFGTNEGKRVIKDLMEQGFLLRTTHVAGDSHESAIREGKRQFVLRILTTLEITEEQIQKLYQEREREMNDE